MNDLFYGWVIGGSAQEFGVEVIRAALCNSFAESQDSGICQLLWSERV